METWASCSEASLFVEILNIHIQGEATEGKTFTKKFLEENF